MREKINKKPNNTKRARNDVTTGSPSRFLISSSDDYDGVVGGVGTHCFLLNIPKFANLRNFQMNAKTRHARDDAIRRINACKMNGSSAQLSAECALRLLFFVFFFVFVLFFILCIYRSGSRERVTKSIAGISMFNAIFFYSPHSRALLIPSRLPIGVRRVMCECRWPFGPKCLSHLND